MKHTCFCLITLITVLVGCARRYPVDGLVLEVNREKKTLLISHRTIPGYMGAMVMPFQVRQPRELSGLSAGSRVDFRLVVRRGNVYAERIREGRGSTRDRDTDPDSLPLPVPAGKLALGSPVPDFQLLNQTGRVVRLSDFRGKVVVVNFIYTRCPLPEVCPRLTASFSQLQRRFRQQMGSDLVLLSITLDAQFDTPQVLAEYGKRWGADPRCWNFLTGPAGDIEVVASQFGLTYWPEEGLLTHTSQTGIVGRDGRLEALIEGSSYEEEQLGDLVARRLEDVHGSQRSALGVAGN